MSVNDDVQESPIDLNILSDTNHKFSCITAFDSSTLPTNIVLPIISVPLSEAQLYLHFYTRTPPADHASLDSDLQLFPTVIPLHQSNRQKLYLSG